MSRSGYSESCEGWELIRWRGAVNSAVKGKRGQDALRELAAALDAMPEKKLISGELQTSTGDVCALGSLAKHRGLDVASVDPYCRESVAGTFNIAEALAAEIMSVNDDWAWHGTPEDRWKTVRKWVADQIRTA